MMHVEKRKRSQRGFTLIELLVVVVIIGLIAAIAIPGLRGAIDQTKQTKTVRELGTMREALERYEIKYDRFPEANNMVALVEVMKQEGFLRDDHSVNDSWKNQFQVDITGTTYTICSGGKDGGSCLGDSRGVTENVNDSIILANGAFVKKPAE